ncbi:MAG: hypothetical protein ACKVT1_14250 [Dehalococcoidia bacterium]
MVVRRTARIEFRLSEEDRCFLEARLRASGHSISSWVRQQIDEEREAVDLAERRAAFERLCSMNVEWIPDDPAALDAMINEQDSPVDDSWQPS